MERFHNSHPNAQVSLSFGGSSNDGYSNEGYDPGFYQFNYYQDNGFTSDIDSGSVVGGVNGGVGVSEFVQMSPFRTGISIFNSPGKGSLFSPATPSRIKTPPSIMRSRGKFEITRPSPNARKHLKYSPAPQVSKYQASKNDKENLDNVGKPISTPRLLESAIFRDAITLKPFEKRNFKGMNQKLATFEPPVVVQQHIPQIQEKIITSDERNAIYSNALALLELSKKEKK
jgi:hypothetical protein